VQGGEPEIGAYLEKRKRRRREEKGISDEVRTQFWKRLVPREFS